MPRVPLPQETLQGGALPAFRAPAVVPQQDATGTQIARLGQAVTAAGTAAANIADVLQDDLDTARTKEALALWNDENRVTLHDPENGYLNKQGKAATGEARVNAQNQIARNAETFSKNLDNEDQRGMFGIAVQQQTLQLSQQMDTHEARAIQVYGIGQAKAFSEESAGNAVDVRTLPGEHTAERELAFQAQKKVATDEALKVADMLGYGPAQTDALVLDTTTAIHVGVIDRFLADGNTGEAVNYFQGVDEDEIHSAARSKISRTLEGASLNDRSALKALDLIDQFDKAAQERAAAVQEPGVAQDPDAATPAPELFAEADATDLGRLANDELNAQLRAGTITAAEKDAILDRVLDEAKIRRDTMVNKTNETQRLAELWLIDNPNKSVSQMEPPSLLQDVRDLGLLGTMKAFADEGGRYDTNNAVFGMILDMPREVLAKMTPGQFHLAFRRHLDDAEFSMAKAHHASLLPGGRGRGGAGTAGAGGAASIFPNKERLLLGAFEGGVIKSLSDTNQNRLQDLGRWLREVALQAELAHEAGEPTGGHHLQPIIDRVNLDRVNGNQVRATLTSEEEESAVVELDVGDIRISSIPDEVRGMLIEELNRQGKPATERNIADLWAEGGRVGSRFEAEQIAREQAAAFSIFEDVLGGRPRLREGPSFPGLFRNRRR